MKNLEKEILKKLSINVDNVTAPPKIRLPRQYEDGLLFEQDETIRLKVSLAGRPSPSVIWYHDGEIIAHDQRHIFETMDGESVLKIPDAKRVDRGEYTVKAVNKLGEDTSSFLVTVTGCYKFDQISSRYRIILKGTKMEIL